MNPPEDLILQLKRKFSRLAPILILAPTPRCGSTLLQRAINQGERAIIYGENFVMMEYAPEYLMGNLRDLEGKTRATGALAQEFMSGNKGLDASSLYPDYAEYRRMLLTFCYQIVEFYRGESLKLGYERWGIKHQLRDFGSLARFLRLMPDYRAVTLYRDIVNVAKSMRSRWPATVETPAHCHELAMRWKVNLRNLLKLDRSRNLVVRYEDLVADQDRQIAKIEAHLGVPLGREAFARKVNAHVSDAKTGKAGDTYLPPSELPAEHMRALLQTAQSLYSELGYRAENEIPARGMPG